MNKQDLKPYKLAQKLRSSANRCTRINADVAILCEHALAAAAWLEDEATDITNMVGSVTHDALMGRMTPGYVISDMPTMSYPAIPTEWIATITFARDIFQNYADLHRVKGTPDGDEKAHVNQDYADMLTALLNNTSAPAQTTAVTTDEWREVMQELADDAEFACDIQYPYRGVYPGDMVKYHAEMAIVRRARGLLERAK